MTWRINMPYVEEIKKCLWEVAPYLRGRGVDIGAGTFKVLPQAISVDNGNHAQFGFNIKPDVRVETAEDMSIFSSQSMDFVFSSHLLEHLDNPEKALREWWRILKPVGNMALYLPAKGHYPDVGEEGCNPDHKFTPTQEMVIDWMKGIGGWDLLENQLRTECDEYSFLQVYKKLEGKRHHLSYLNTKPDKRVLVCRFGAYGDMMQSSSVVAGLKQQGYHVTLMCSPPACEVVKHDPNVDAFMILEKDQIPNQNLSDFWAWQEKNYDKFVNLSETVEGSFLALPGRTAHHWTPACRHIYMNYNYLEFQHKLAGVPHKPQVKFYATAEEKQWAKKQRQKMGEGIIVMWSLAGSSVHKTWAGLDNILAGILLHYPTAKIVLVGGPECAILEQGWDNEPRVHKTCGKWSIRQSLSFLEECDLVIGPETGVLNAACDMEVAKICLLSHSTWENLTRDWKNTTAIWSDNTTCKGRGNNEAPACHSLHYGWNHCTKDEKSGTAQCQADITIEEVWNAVEQQLEIIVRKVA